MGDCVAGKVLVKDLREETAAIIMSELAADQSKSLPVDLSP
jgi:hypothetical protein